MLAMCFQQYATTLVMKMQMFIQVINYSMSLPLVPIDAGYYAGQHLNHPHAFFACCRLFVCVVEECMLLVDPVLCAVAYAVPLPLTLTPTFWHFSGVP